MSITQVLKKTKAGSLHRALGVKPGVKIPIVKLRRAMKWKSTPRDRALAAKAALVYRFAVRRGEA